MLDIDLPVIHGTWVRAILSDPLPSLTLSRRFADPSLQSLILKVNESEKNTKQTPGFLIKDCPGDIYLSYCIRETKGTAQFTNKSASEVKAPVKKIQCIIKTRHRVSNRTRLISAYLSVLRCLLWKIRISK